MFRVVVVSSDGVKCGVAIGPVSDHRREPSSATLNMVADRLRVPRDEILEVLGSWSAAKLRRHLRTRTAAELRPPARGH